MNLCFHILVHSKADIELPNLFVGLFGAILSKKPVGMIKSMISQPVFI